MSRRVAVACALAAALVLAVVAALAISLGDGSPPASQDASGANSGPYRGSEIPGGITLRDFSLHNFDGDSCVRAISPVV
jgi:hypothetical protein